MMRDPVQDARVAQDILDNVVFQAAVDAVDDKFIDEWRKGLTQEVRERAHVKQEVLGEVCLALSQIISEGVLHEHLNKQNP